MSVAGEETTHEITASQARALGYADRERKAGEASAKEWRARADREEREGREVFAAAEADVLRELGLSELPKEAWWDLGKTPRLVIPAPKTDDEGGEA